MSDVVVYNDGELELDISVDEGTIWLTQSQISELFSTSTDNVGLHLKNIYKEQELEEASTTENYSVVRQEGNRRVKRVLRHYNLDVIISVGYRVSSHKATKFKYYSSSLLGKLFDGLKPKSFSFSNCPIRFPLPSIRVFLLLS